MKNEVARRKTIMTVLGTAFLVIGLISLIFSTYLFSVEKSEFPLEWIFQVLVGIYLLRRDRVKNSKKMFNLILAIMVGLMLWGFLGDANLVMKSDIDLLMVLMSMMLLNFYKEKEGDKI